MTEAPQPRTEGSDNRPNRLGQAAAVVGIVAGILFIVAVIFFSGLVIGAGQGHHHGNYRGQSDDRPTNSCPMMNPGGMMGPGGMRGPGGNSPMMPGVGGPTPRP
jgi:hypothetical protein